MMRKILPARRESETFETEIRGTGYTISFSRFDDGRVAEIFARCAIGSSDLDNDVADACVAVSLALQFGAELSSLRKSMLRARNGRPAGALGSILDAIDQALMVAPTEAAPE